MIICDFILANKDRHFNNFGVVRNVETLEFERFAPIFDNGCSLWYDENDLYVGEFFLTKSPDLRESPESTKYLFFVFKKENTEYVFKGIKLWNIPELIIDNEVQTMWKRTVNIIKSGNIVNSINNGIRETNFPSTTQSKVCHVRPRARDAQDTYPLPVTDKLTGSTEYTKHCFWFNRSYLEEILKEYINE